MDSYAPPCHGAEGDGKGPRAGQLYPRPRDFTKGVYEFRSTPTGTLPTDEDIWKVVSGGLHGTAMVPWITFSENDRWALVAYIESLSPRFAHERRDDAIKMTDAPAETPQLIAQGHGLFGDAGCTECHGIEGRGDGPSSSSLVDAAGLPIRPLDFHGRVFRARLQHEGHLFNREHGTRRDSHALVCELPHGRTELGSRGIRS